MVRHGIPPYLECSSKGETRLSAFYARIKSRSRRSIEDIYQAAKVFEGGVTGLGWREAKGKYPVNGAEVKALYSVLWDEYIAENPALLDLIVKSTGLSDMFGKPGNACQATELWRIRERALLKSGAKATFPDTRGARGEQMTFLSEEHCAPAGASHHRNEVFVFGSNLAGRHGAGAALDAKDNHGAIYGQGEGLQGSSYAIPTKDGRDRQSLKAPYQTLPLPAIKAAVERFLEFANSRQDLVFNIMPIGCGLAGYKPHEIAPFFADAPKNCNLPAEFIEAMPPANEVRRIMAP